jgi:dienelactone hydrolase
MLRLVESLMLLGLSASVAFAADEPLTFDDTTVGEPLSFKTAELFRPAREGRFPAIVVMHGCNGFGRHERIWARRLVSWGYAALTIDGFRPRGVEQVCDRSGKVLPVLRARDAFAAAAYLRQRADIDGDHIGLIGFSHGGRTALATAIDNARRRAGTAPFRGIVAYYPGCPPQATPPLATDVLILAGSADDWAPAAECSEFAARYPEGSPHRPVIKVYDGALHGFDSEIADRIFFGHHLAYNEKADRDATAMTWEFFDEHLRR